MQVRLAFSIAIQAKSDILLIDEVLAVGDENFQRKCMEHFVKLKQEKQTVVFITHDMAQVRRFCDRALYLEKGKIVKIGTTAEIANIYAKKNLEVDTKAAKDDAKKAHKDVQVTFLHGNRIEWGKPLEMTLHWNKNAAIKNVGIAIIKDTGEYVFGANTLTDKVRVEDGTVSYSVDCNLAPGKYNLSVGLFGDNDIEVIAFESNAAVFGVEASEATQDWGGLTHLKHRWK